MPLLRQDLGGTPPTDAGECRLALWLMSDVQVLDAASPARCEWVELLADLPQWQALLHMHRPYDALTHWALAAHVEAARRNPCAPNSRRPYDLALSLGDNIDNAQRNELDTFLAIVAGGSARLPAWGSVQDSSGWHGTSPWPYWCPDARVDDTWKQRGYPAIPDFLERAGAELPIAGLGFAWASVPGNHDLMRQGTALPGPAIEAIAAGARKQLAQPHGLDPADPLALFVEDPAAFSLGGIARVTPQPDRRAVDKKEWIAAHAACGAAGYGAPQVDRVQTDAVIDTPHARILLLDTHHPQGDFQGSVGNAQLDWLDARLSEVDREPGRFAVLASHHGAMSLTNTRGDDPQRQLADSLVAVLHRHPSLVAWLVGHRHVHAVRAHPGAIGGFWEISTGSVIDWPVQTRAVEFTRHGDGQIAITCTLQDHGAAADTPAGWHHSLARRFAGAHAPRMQGSEADGNVQLVLPPANPALVRHTGHAMPALTGLAWLLLCQSAGEALVRLLHLRLPGPVIGMLLLLGLLRWPAVRSGVAACADALLAHLSLLFVPVGVGVMTHLGVLSDYGLRLLLALVLSTWIGLAVTAWVLRRLLRRQLVPDALVGKEGT